MSFAWRHRLRSLYEDYCFPDELTNDKLLSLLEKYHKAFDDNFTYEVCGRKQVVIVRRPLWLGWQSDRGLSEKYKRFDLTVQRQF